MPERSNVIQRRFNKDIGSFIKFPETFWRKCFSCYLDGRGLANKIEPIYQALTNTGPVWGEDETMD